MHLKVTPSKIRIIVIRIVFIVLLDWGVNVKIMRILNVIRNNIVGQYVFVVQICPIHTEYCLENITLTEIWFKANCI